MADRDAFGQDPIDRRQVVPRKLLPEPDGVPPQALPLERVIADLGYEQRYGVLGYVDPTVEHHRLEIVLCRRAAGPLGSGCGIDVIDAFGHENPTRDGPR